MTNSRLMIKVFQSFNTESTTSEMTPHMLYIISFVYLKIIHCYGNPIDIDNTSKDVNIFSENKKCVNKCCPGNQIVELITNSCVNYTLSDSVLDFSEMKVYNEERTKHLTTVPKALDIVTAPENTTFIKKHFPITLLPGMNFYLTENGNLYKEIPNYYDRWTRWEPKDFCIDYMINPLQPTLGATPHIWVENNSKVPQTKPYEKYANLVSCFFLVLVFVVYLLLPDLRNLGGKIVMAYVFSLFWAYVFLYINQNHAQSHCMPMALVSYFFYMSTFCWMNIMSFDIWWTFRGYAKSRTIHRRGEVCKFLMYCLYAHGLPLTMTAGIGIVDSLELQDYPWIVTPSIGRGQCFLEAGSRFLYLYIPMTILIIMNWLFFLMTAFNVWRLCRGTKVLNLADSRSSEAQNTQWSRFMVYLKLAVVMGLSWVCEMLSYLCPGVVWTITDVYNLFIGLAIFIIFVCKKKIYKKLMKRFKEFRRNHDWRASALTTENVTSNFTIQDSSRRAVSVHRPGPEFEVKI